MTQGVPTNPAVTLQGGVFNVQFKCANCGATNVVDVGELVIQGIFEQGNTTMVANFKLRIAPENP